MVEVRPVHHESRFFGEEMGLLNSEQGDILRSFPPPGFQATRWAVLGTQMGLYLGVENGSLQGLPDKNLRQRCERQGWWLAIGWLSVADTYINLQYWWIRPSRKRATVVSHVLRLFGVHQSLVSRAETPVMVFTRCDVIELANNHYK